MIIQEIDLPHSYEQIVEPFWRSSIKTGSFLGVDNVPIHYAYCIPKQATSSVVISTGRVESYLKYKEVIFDLYSHQIAVFIMDHRGQGLSGRMTKDPHLGFVEKFEDYVEDFRQFYLNIVEPNRIGDISLLCHSMGSAIGALVILKQSNWFEKVIFCSPMFGVRPAIPLWLFSFIISSAHTFNKCLGKPVNYFWSQGKYHATPYKSNALCNSEVRYELFRELYRTHPEIQLGGVSTTWLKAALLAMNYIEKNANYISLPVLTLSAGADTIVDNNRQRRVVSNMPNNTFVEVANAKHELFLETDEIRVLVMERILDFLQS